MHGYVWGQLVDRGGNVRGVLVILVELKNPIVETR